MIYEVYDKYYLYEMDGKYSVVKRDRRRTKVFEGTLEECEDFINRHPYG